MFCPSCQIERAAGSKYCAECGTPLTHACTTCGAKLPADAKFCLECGSALLPVASAPSPYTPQHLGDGILATHGGVRGERKQVTVLFCDIVESTMHARRLGAEGMHALLDTFFGLATQHVHHFEGTINQFLGDGFMALFGAPVAHEDHAHRAVLAAVALRDAAATDARLAEIELRIGINSGAVVVGAIGDDLRMDYTAFGDNTILAARLQAAAAPGDILLSESAAQAVRSFVDVTPAGPVVVKESTVRPFRVVSVGSRRSRVAETDRRLAPFVGRSAELTALIEARNRIVGSEGSIVNVIGEPGIGKSRLLFELQETSGGPETAMLEGRCLSYGAGVPYVPVIDLLRSTAGIGPNDGDIAERLRGVLDRSGMETDRTLPYLLQLLGNREAGRELEEVDPASVKGHTFEILRDLWLGLAQRTPLVLMLEDLHWVDRTSEEFFASLADELAAAPILLVTTYRPGYNPPWSGKSFSMQLALRPLDAASSQELIRGAGGVPDAVAEAIVARGEGNPFFLEELARSATEAHAEPLAVPQTVQEVLAARIDRLREASKRAVQTAAILGREFTLPLLEAVWDGSNDVRGELQELKRLELLFERRRGDERIVVFKHALTQEVAYDSLLESRRHALHRRAGAAVEEIYADRIDEHYELLAHHYGRSDDQEKAVDYLVLANQKAASRNAMEEAIGYFYEALEALEALPDTRENQVRRLELVFGQTGEFHFLHRHREYYDLILRHEALAHELADPQFLGAFLARLGHRQWTFGDFDAALVTLTRAAELCERCESDHDAASVYAILAWTHLMLGNYDAVDPARDLALANLVERFNPVWYSFARCASLLAHTWTGRFGAAANEADEATRVGNARSDSAIVSFNRGFLAYTRVQQRDWVRAIEEAQVSIEHAPTVYFQGFPQTFLATALGRSGASEQGLPILDAIESMTRASEHWAAWMVVGMSRAEVLVGARDTDRATPILTELAELAEARRAAIWIAQSHRLLAECSLIAGGPADKATTHIERAIDVSRQTGMENELALALAVAGRLSRQSGAETTAQAQLGEALGIFERLGTLVEPARVRDELGSAANRRSTASTRR